MEYFTQGTAGISRGLVDEHFFQVWYLLFCNGEHHTAESRGWRWLITKLRKQCGGLKHMHLEIRHQTDRRRI
jgi:hypothetical protein